MKGAVFIEFSVLLLTLLALDQAGPTGHMAVDPSNWVWLPHFNGFMNLAICCMLVFGYRAIRRGDRIKHPRFMLTACVFGVVFLAGYIAHWAIFGHQRFPGDDWLRTLFVVVLFSHTVLAVAVVPCIVTIIVLALRQSFDRHRRFARITLAMWAYVAVTGLFVYVMNNHIRPVPLY
ncbi:MAG: DUF420 domain-containing protein [Acidobacteria bacterium]|nr:DUF420 domain-containing protein [Acidobacteriota bacterium]